MASARCIRLIAVLVIGVLGMSACGSDDGDGESARSADAESEDSASAAECDTAGPADDLTTTNGDNAHTFSFDGDDRSYLLALPEGYDGTTPHPLLFNFHGFGANIAGYESYTAMGELGTERGYVVVTPEAAGVPPEWNYLGDQNRPDDFGFIDALVSHLTGQLCIDEERLYAAGHSAGSAVTGFLVCREPYRFAAAAMVAAFIPTTCPTAEVAPSAIVFQGTADPMVPYDGGAVAAGPGIPAALDTLDQYVERYRCGEPLLQQPSEGVELRSLLGCDHGSEVLLYSFTGGGHGWPGNEAGLDLGGEPDSPLIGFPATETILDFFDDHP